MLKKTPKIHINFILHDILIPHDTEKWSISWFRNMYTVIYVKQLKTAKVNRLSSSLNFVSDDSAFNEFLNYVVWEQSRKQDLEDDSIK